MNKLSLLGNAKNSFKRNVKKLQLLMFGNVSSVNLMCPTPNQASILVMSAVWNNLCLILEKMPMLLVLLLTLKGRLIQHSNADTHIHHPYLIYTVRISSSSSSSNTHTHAHTYLFHSALVSFSLLSIPPISPRLKMSSLAYWLCYQWLNRRQWTSDIIFQYAEMNL